MRTADFDFELPRELIAQTPLPRRDESRLMVLDRHSERLTHRRFAELIEYLRPGDVLVLNNSRVIPARLRAQNTQTAGQFEVLLLEENAVNDWWVMLRPGKRARRGTRIEFRDLKGEQTGVTAVVIEHNDEGHRRLRFEGTPNILNQVESLGEVPLPPYIIRASAAQMEADRERYQTVYAELAGSVAAPTAGLHFTEALLGNIRARGVNVCFLTLHVGLGTFAPVKAESISEHVMHEERYEIPANTAEEINRAKRGGQRVLAVGTTTLRVLESARGEVQPGRGRTRIFIHPPYEFKIVDGLVTNFHLPRSTLLMLVSAFAVPGEVRGRDVMLSAYHEAIREGYRFFSYGDAMLIL
jgi:S-adenosylmethionine:tRNA ribosyltransferase-isomerase